MHIRLFGFTSSDKGEVQTDQRTDFCVLSPYNRICFTVEARQLQHLSRKYIRAQSRQICNKISTCDLTLISNTSIRGLTVEDFYSLQLFTSLIFCDTLVTALVYDEFALNSLLGIKLKLFLLVVCQSAFCCCSFLFIFHTN